MISQIVFTHDILKYRYDEKVCDSWLCDLISFPLYKATGIGIIKLKDLKSKVLGDEAVFSQNKFLNLSNVQSNEEISLSKLVVSEDSWYYLSQFVDKKTLIIGTELGREFRQKLSELGIVYVGFSFHPYKLFDDILLLMTTNNVAVYEKIFRWKVPEENFYQTALYWKNSIRRNLLDNLSVEGNSILFVGQTYSDYSVFNGNKYLNITDFKNDIAKYTKNYNKMYYSPHPYSGKMPCVDEYLADSKNGVTITDVPSYFLLSSEKICKVVSISSSILYEAKFFLKDTEYLFKPLFDIDVSFGKNSYVSIYQKYFNPMFWSDILEPILQTKKCEDEYFFEQSKNKIRNLLGAYHGYENLDIAWKAIRKSNKNERQINEILRWIKIPH